MKSPVILLLALFTLVSIDIQAQNTDHSFIEQVDTIITFNPDTYEESIQVIRRLVKKESPSVVENQMNIEEMIKDTIITFDPATQKEEIVIVTRKKEALTLTPIMNLDTTGEIQVDTIITFDPTTMKETIQIIHRVKKE